MMMNIAPVVGVFDEVEMADQAVKALTIAGFDTRQISYLGHASDGGFLSGIKTLFTGEDKTIASASDLKNMGMGEGQARYYEDEHNAGHPVIAVRANGREEEARAILHEAGAYDDRGETRSGDSGERATSSSKDGYFQPGGYNEQSRMTEKDVDVGGNSSVS